MDPITLIGILAALLTLGGGRESPTEDNTQPAPVRGRGVSAIAGAGLVSIRPTFVTDSDTSDTPTRGTQVSIRSADLVRRWTGSAIHVGLDESSMPYVASLSDLFATYPGEGLPGPVYDPSTPLPLHITQSLSNASRAVLENDWIRGKPLLKPGVQEKYKVLDARKFDIIGDMLEAHAQPYRFDPRTRKLAAEMFYAAKLFRDMERIYQKIREEREVPRSYIEEYMSGLTGVTAGKIQSVASESASALDYGIIVAESQAFIAAAPVALGAAFVGAMAALITDFGRAIAGAFTSSGGATFPMENRGPGTGIDLAKYLAGIARAEGLVRQRIASGRWRLRAS